MTSPSLGSMYLSAPLGTLGKYRTDPSQKATLNPPLKNFPSFGAVFPSAGSSSGLVHTTASSASAIIQVFDVPSGMLAGILTASSYFFHDPFSPTNVR